MKFSHNIICTLLFCIGICSSTYAQYNLETAVQDDEVMQGFELESAPTEIEHSQKVKAPPMGSDYISKDYVNLSSSNAVSRFKAEVKEIDVGDVKIAYYIRGQGKPLFMINGFLSTMSLWDPALIEELAANYQLILFDNRGVGLSTDTKENKTTISQMADDVAGLIKNLGYEKVNILAWSMGARIGQQLLIRHPAFVEKAILCSANPGGSQADKTALDTENKLNNPNTPEMEKISLVFTDDEQGKLAAKDCLARLKEAVAAGTIPDDFTVSKETSIRQTRARTTLWSNSNENFDALKNIKKPVLLADGRNDIIDLPKNSVIIANQIPHSWTAFLEGGHAFLFQNHKQFSDLVHAFLQ